VKGDKETERPATGCNQIRQRHVITRSCGPRCCRLARWEQQAGFIVVILLVLLIQPVCAVDKLDRG
jgi:hypothetical protein